MSFILPLFFLKEEKKNICELYEFAYFVDGKWEKLKHM